MGSQKLLFLVFAEKQYIYKSNRQKQQKQLDRFQHLPEHANFNLHSWERYRWGKTSFTITYENALLKQSPPTQQSTENQVITSKNRNDLRMIFLTLEKE